MSMAGYTKLFNSILASTIWRESDTTRLVWITLLAMSDKEGICEGSIPGLADLARVSVEDCETALASLTSPDSYSRTSEHEGRRVEILDGVGWQLLNHAKYRMKMSEDERREYNRKKQAEHRARLKAEKEAQEASLTVIDSQSQSAMSAHTDTDTEADTEKEEEKRAASPPHPALLTPAHDNPAVQIYEEKFGVKVSNAFAQEVVENVHDLGLWTRLISEKIAFASGKTEERQRIAKWFLKAYFERVEQKQNERKQSSKLQSAEEKLASDAADRRDRVPTRPLSV